jgi:hypothetical protein
MTGVFMVQFLAGARDFFFLQNVETSPGDHPAFHSVGVGAYFLTGLKWLGHAGDN